MSLRLHKEVRKDISFCPPFSLQYYNQYNTILQPTTYIHNNLKIITFLIPTINILNDKYLKQPQHRSINSTHFQPFSNIKQYHSIHNCRIQTQIVETYQQIFVCNKSNSTFHKQPYEIISNHQPRSISIEFNERQKWINSANIKQKHRIMSNSQKYYNKKKYQCHSSIQQVCKKTRSIDMSSQAMKTISIRTISNNMKTNKRHWLTFEAKNHNLKKQIFDTFSKKQKQTNTNQKYQTNQVMVFKRRVCTQLVQQAYLIQNQLRRSNEPNQKQQKDNEFQHSKSVSIDQYLPFKKEEERKDPFIFGLCQKVKTKSKQKKLLLQYHDFIWKLNYSNGLYVRPTQQDVIYKVFIGSGNNSNLIKNTIRKRFWWTITDQAQNSSLVWTQLKINSIFKKQITTENQEETNLTLLQQNQSNNYDDSFYGSHSKIFNKQDMKNWMVHMSKFHRSEEMINQKTYKNRKALIANKQMKRISNSTNLIVHNHLNQNYFIGNKKSLYYHMKLFYDLQGKNIFDVLPVTFHLSKGVQDPQYAKFIIYHNSIQELKKYDKNNKNIWIIKPGQNSNRGNGISICFSLDDIKLRLKTKQRNKDGSLRSFILQKYIQRPVLYKGRKFDLRNYLLVTIINGTFKAYWYKEGYIRTSSELFSLKKQNNVYVHLTNDAIQKTSNSYSKYEEGNKISYQQFQSYLNKLTGQKSNSNIFCTQIMALMKNQALNAVKSTYLHLDPMRKQHNFQLFGLDYMIDEALKPWLIQINTNPCLETNSPLLQQIIPELIEQTFKVCVDPLFPPPYEWQNSKKMNIPINSLEQNKFQLIFDESIDGQKVKAILSNNQQVSSSMGKVQQDSQQYRNEGEEEQNYY